MDYLSSLLNTLIALPSETEWLEFKHNNSDPQKIGEYISALSNSATLNDKQCGYIIWGIQDKTHKIVGTQFRPKETRVKKQELENWLKTQLSPRIDFKICEFRYQEKDIVLFAKKLSLFEKLARKSVRVVTYDGKNRLSTIREFEEQKGYANSFEDLIHYINIQLPQNEVINTALRTKARMYPEIAIRELVANAIIHQNFDIRGTGPMIEIFSDRVEITNPGKPLIEPIRFIDQPPRSRNEALAAFMRRINICEERGSGIDKVINSVEVFQLPAPIFKVTSNSTQAILFAYKKFVNMDKDDRIRACYQHTCLKFVSNEQMTNSSLRKRFSIEPKNSSMASRIITDTINAGLIKTQDPNTNSRKYIPFWA